MSRRRRLPIVVLLAIATFASLLLVEGLLRIVTPTVLAAPSPLRLFATTDEPSSAGFVAHPGRAYDLAPHNRHGPSHLGRYATGAWRWRGRPGTPLPPDVARVVLIGDSCVYGVGVDVADMYGTQLAAALDAAGQSPERVAVLSLGVPGYSTEQLDLLLIEALEQWRPDVVVLFPAAWNDQAPAMEVDDATLLRRYAQPGPIDALAARSRLAELLAHFGRREDPARVVAAWRDGRPLHGERVPESRVEPVVRRMIRRCRDAQAHCLVVAAAHPPKTRTTCPRTRRDAAAVLRAAVAEGAPALDAQAIADGAGCADESGFIDFVHPSPTLIRAIVAALAPLVAPALPATRDSSARQSLSITGLTPATASVFGDGALTVELAGWSRDQALPVILVGGGPLIDVHAVGEHAVRGFLMADGAGRKDLVLQTESSCVRLREAVVREDVSISCERAPLRIRLAGRPGDEVQLFAAMGRSSAPSWSLSGASLLDGSATALGPPTRFDEAGLIDHLLPADADTAFLLQVLASPAGEPAGRVSSATRWMSPVRVEPLRASVTKSR